MKLIITDSIERSEILPLKNIFSRETILESAKKCLKGIGKSIKNTVKTPYAQLKKLNLTSTGGHGRVVFLLTKRNKEVVLVMIKLKNDKAIGENMSISNPKFKKQLNKDMDLIINDIKSKKYVEYDLS